MSVTPAPGAGLFSLVQVEVPWPLGPPDGRYVMRGGDGGDGHVGDEGDDGDTSTITHVAVLATLGAAPRHRLGRGLGARGRARAQEAEPAPTAVSNGRATIIAVQRPLGDAEAARAWLRGAGEPELSVGLGLVNRVLHAFRLATADPHVGSLSRQQLIAARIGYGTGEQVAAGRWAQARELAQPSVRARRRQVLAPQARLAAMLGARQPPLVCEELVLRARSDLDAGRPREAALQLLVTLDAALAELAADPRAASLEERLAELRGRRDAVAAAAQAALAGSPSAAARETVASTVSRIEAALRARAAAGS